MRVLSVHGLFTVDERRSLREKLHPAVLLSAGYYERRLLPTKQLLIRNDILAEGEVRARLEAGSDSLPVREDPELVTQTREQLASGSSYEMDPAEPRFLVGDQVTVRNSYPASHTRCPRYVRQADGVVDAFHGTQRFPDAAAKGIAVGEPLYSVRFAASELWGDYHSSGDSVVLQLWEPYLEAP